MSTDITKKLTMDSFDKDLDDEDIPILTQQLAEVVIDISADRVENVAEAPKENDTTLKPRNYQLEMVDESMKRNIIVVLDTGSGKTHIAVLRIRAELERTPDDKKFVWFLAPTVTLCYQQYQVLKSQLPDVYMKFLSGNDGVDKWSEQFLWDNVLRDVRIVISTYAILRDALTHAFVTMEKLALIVIDEAHNCVKAHPGAQIMNTFYHPRKAQGLPVPHVLGLTASPIMRSTPSSLYKIEQTLDAVCRTPTQHRNELLQYVKPPKILRVNYKPLPPKNELLTYTSTLRSLHQVYTSLDIMQDPEVVWLRNLRTDRGRRDLQKVIERRKTYCQEHIKSFCLTSSEICHELGAWAADVFVATAISTFVAYAEEDFELEESWKVTSRRYTAEVLKRVQIVNMSPSPIMGTPMISPKAEALIDLLLQEKSPDFAGIVFVQQRATVAMLSRLLSAHPRSKDVFNIGTFVGTSQHSRREASINDLLDIREQSETLDDFKSGSRNLIIATSVLEEGIDVSACAFVACFSAPANLKAYIQRRGRARKLDSKIAIMTSSDEQDKLKKWQEIENIMHQMYEDQLRELKKIEEEEQDDEEVDAKREFWVQSTGAYLNLENAVPHLHHFCNTLPAKYHVDVRPDIFCEKDHSGKFRAKAVLPLSVDAYLRFAQSKLSWKSERNAIRDVAFEAYMALYNAGLINDNLMPLLRHETRNLFSEGVEKRPSLVEVSELMNPWVEIARLWDQQPALASSLTVCSDEGSINSEFQVILPVSLPHLSTSSIYWDTKTTFVMNSKASTTRLSSEGILRAARATKTMLNAAYGHRFPVSGETFTALFASEDLLKIADYQVSSQPIVSCAQIEAEVGELGLIRDKGANNIPYLFRGWLERRPNNTLAKYPTNRVFENIDDVPHVIVSPLPRRSDFLHEVVEFRPSKELVLPITTCTIDSFPFKYVQFAMLIPSIMHVIEIHLIAEALNNKVLAGVEFNDLGLVVTAISSSRAREQNNYQRLEFLGDSCLKLCASMHLISKNLRWHEGYLSAGKDRLVANSRLARAAMDLGLDKFILTKPFTGQKWRPMYNQEVLSVGSPKKREMSTKVLADIVEALLGAAMVEGGVQKVLSCLKVFLPDTEWVSLEKSRDILYNLTHPDTILPRTLHPLEKLVGHTFIRKSLLIQAMTHASSTNGVATYERLEFLGDAVLDSIVVDKIFACHSEIPPAKMHLIRTAAVNADFLAFLCMEWSSDQETARISENRATKNFEVNKFVFKTPLWKFMRHTPSYDMTQMQAVIAARYKVLRELILSEITSGNRVPWTLLAGLGAQKWYSDLVESLVGAIYIDSGSFSACEDMLEKIGLLPYLRRLRDEDIRLLHPKQELGILADTEKVTYILDVDRSEKEERGKGILYTCEVLVGERSIVKVDKGISKLEAMTRAADEAVRTFDDWKISKTEKDSAHVTEEVVDEMDIS